jgi:hypothetical protein
MKAGNSGEGKTLVTGCLVILAVMSQKLMTDAKGGRNLKVCWNLDGQKMKALKEGRNPGRSDDLVKTGSCDDADGKYVLEGR